MRSHVGRLTRETNKSGSGRKELTDRDKWVKEKFGFLGPHIARLTTRAGVNLTEKLKARHGKNDDEDSSAGDAGDEDSQEDDDSRLTEELDCEDAPLPNLIPAKKTRQGKPKKPADITKDLEEAIRQSTELQEQVKAKLTGPQDSRSVERQHWGQWMTSFLPSIDDRIWYRFKRESMDLMERFQAETTELQRRDNQRQDMTSQQFTNERMNYTSSSTGYLPNWQHQYQLPGQELAYQQGGTSVDRTQHACPDTRSYSAPPSTATNVQDNAIPPSVSNLINTDLNADSPASSLYSL